MRERLVRSLLVSLAIVTKSTTVIVKFTLSEVFRAFA